MSGCAHNTEHIITTNPKRVLHDFNRFGLVKLPDNIHVISGSIRSPRTQSKPPLRYYLTIEVDEETKDKILKDSQFTDIKNGIYHCRSNKKDHSQPEDLLGDNHPKFQELFNDNALYSCPGAGQPLTDASIKEDGEEKVHVIIIGKHTDHYIMFFTEIS